MNEDECVPLESLCKVFNWKNNIKIYHNALEYKPKSLINNERAKTLVCHDMAGGYLNDRFVNGCSDPDSYRFYHWSQIDIFVYFSHKFVTLPPLCWINAAHLHQVPVLGTFITEWKDGEKICEEFLSDAETYTKLADALVEIAVALKFDGWLINIENKIQLDHIGNLIDFVKILHEKMHDSNKYSYVLWYDSVIKNGTLKWQNELNSENRCFFDVCDGIFINYTWNDENLSRSVKEADCRLHDVYIGVDVFGRGCLGGGGFSTNIAMKAVKEKDLSSAIFAPGWVHEVCGTENFRENEAKFWSLLTPYCCHSSITTLPIKTSMCQGFGFKTFNQGKVVSEDCWFNLSLQNLQPTFEGEYENRKIELFTDDAYNGGSCRQFKGVCDQAGQCIYYGLFKVDVVLKNQLLVKWATKVQMENESDVYVKILLKSQEISCSTDAGSANVEHLTNCNENGWLVRKCVISADAAEDNLITEIGIEIKNTNAGEYSVLLGYLEVLDIDKDGVAKLTVNHYQSQNQQ